MRKLSLKHIDYYAFLLLIISLPFFRQLSAATYSLWVLCWLIKIIFYRKSKTFFNFSSKNNRIAFGIVLIYFAILCLSLLWSNDVIKGYHKLETKLALLITPFIISNVSINYKKKQNEIIRVFIYSILFSSVLCILLSFCYSFQTSLPGLQNVLFAPYDLRVLKFNPGSNFFYQDFSHFMHPTYYAMLISLSIAILRVRSLNKIRIEKYRDHLVILFLLFILFLLSSKAGILASFFILFIDVIVRNFSIYKIKTIICGLLFYSILMYVTLNYNFRKPLEDISENANIVAQAGEIGHNNSISSRVIAWRIAFEVIGSNPIMGVGIGDSNIEMKKEYKANEFASGERRFLNAHNQYLEEGVRLGIVGILMLIVVLGFPVYIGIKKKYILLVYFIFIIGVNCLFESILEKQTGVMFFSVFYCFFIFIYRPR